MCAMNLIMLSSAASSIIIVLSFAFFQASLAFSPSPLSSPFGVKSANAFNSFSSSQLTMAVIPEGPGPNEREQGTNRRTDSDSISSFQNGQPSGIPQDMILPLEEDELDSSSFTAERLDRIKRESDARSKFLHGDELIELRKYMQNLEKDLERAREQGDYNAIHDLSRALHESQQMDAEHVYLLALENMESAKRNGFDDEVEDYRQEALLARTCLPQFQLSGLWVGKYGDHGYEMVNITYAGGELGNVLVATKVTGDKNVPKGEITFTADLHPEAKGRKELNPIELSDVAAKQWGHKHLPRFPGQGQVAAEGFVNNQWMDGQLILVGEYFSFAWLPIGHQIFFGRPSAELTLKMLKQSKMADYGANNVDVPSVLAKNRAFAQRCFEETELMLFDDEADGELCFLVDHEDYFCQEGCFE